ncbi:hypothetical protein BCR36DRAFT_397449 [Piromyces finnis]|uniref:EGF-like domain-containing protein n=1 Tax=Piromyces finnis TaxID=1754191 RepID=A0A1Y1V9W1_9FUNG|nr:hypothetical protein BCR36DRAFT_397449 [Piromyces finnis]|eukprot:ORX50769.1 hypothetical protein BCR36DRAFT_397449 [Piromyces finnis]
MFKCKDILFIILFIYFFVSKAYAIEYKVKFNDTNFNNIKDFVNGIQNITVQSNITFIGNTNGTIFDFGKVPRGRLIFSYPSRGYTVKIENIIFENYSSTGLYDVEMMIINVYSDNYYFILNNCTFQNNYYRVIRIDTAINKWTHTHPSVIINNCNFYNNIEGVLKEIRYVINYSEDLYKTLYIQINNSTFINNKGLFVLQYGRLEINNCYFNEVEKNSMDNHEVVFIGNFNSHDDVFINNSKFEDIKIESLYPLINGENLNLRVENTSFLNCKSATGYLFHLKNKESLYKDQTIYFKNNTFQDSISIFHGDYNKIIIEDSIFKDTIYKNSLPAISDSKGSRFIISNTQFFNLSLSSSLFKEDSFYSLNKIKLTDITTNYIAVFQFFQNNVNIENMEVENIQCVGDTDRTSFLLYDSGEDKKTININNVSIKNSISNGPFIKIKGDISEINMNNVNIKSVRSYGSIIKDLSTKSIISISNSNFNENRNLNKLECGSIHFSNNLLLSIENSEFSNNHCQSNGGAICIDEIVSMDLNLISNIFSDNKSLNGGALYLKDSNNTISNNLSNIQIKNNIFRNNVVENFGGAIYSEYSNLYLAKTENNSIIYNSAGIIGGGIYSPFSINKNLFDINSFEIGNNTISGYINDYASKPSYITLNKKLDIKNKELRPGDYLPLIFTLYDEFDQLYNDIIKYYSMLSLNLDLVEINSQGINILACDKYQIKMYKNGILSCEIPVCKDTCPISSTAICRPYINEFVNNKENNICECLSGWEGEYCEKKKLVNFG